MLYILLAVIIVLVVVAVIVVKLFEESSSEEEPLPYKAKQYLFSRSEHEFLRILHEQIDTNRYLVFPKVRLADFITVTARGKEYQGWWNKIRSKHVDFLIWDVQNNKIALAIEIDGKSHNSEKMQVRDEFIDKLYKRVGISLKRVVVGADFSAVITNYLGTLGK